MCTVVLSIHLCFVFSNGDSESLAIRLMELKSKVTIQKVDTGQKVSTLK